MSGSITTAAVSTCPITAPRHSDTSVQYWVVHPECCRAICMLRRTLAEALVGIVQSSVRQQRPLEGEGSVGLSISEQGLQAREAGS